MAFAVSMGHSRHITAQFRQAGVAVEHLDGTMPLDERGEVLARLDAGETTSVSSRGVLCIDAATEILTVEGWTSIDEMTPEHLVAGWRDGEITFERPTAVHRRMRMPGERMVRFQSVYADIRITEGHGVVHRSLPGERWHKHPVRDLLGRTMFLPAVGFAPDIEEPEFAGLLEDLRRHELQTRGDDVLPDSFTVYSGCLRALDRLQAVAACRGFRARLCMTRRPGRWGLVVNNSGDIPVRSDDFAFEEGHRDERVWCVTIPSGAIVTRRCGAVVVLGNCAGWSTIEAAVRARAEPP